MAKNFAALYNGKNDSTSLEQGFYIVEETVRGVIKAPIATDYLDTLSGGSIEFNQAKESSPQRSGRHNNSMILGKKSLSWSMPTFVNIDTSLLSPSSLEIDASMRLLWRSALGHEDLTAGASYDSSTTPATTFSIFEVGDVYAKQARGCFVDQAEISLPGDGRAQVNFSGMGAESIQVGIGKSVTANAGNTITLGTGEGRRFPVGSLVMIIKSDGVTRSADTPVGSPRLVVARLGDAITVDGAVLADASGTTTPVYLSYYEPPTQVAISNPQTGLQGRVTIDGLTEQCIRSATITIANNHELEDYCYGYDAVHGNIFTPASRLTVSASVEMNLNASVLEFFNKVQDNEGQAIEFILGDESSRYMQVLTPRVIFNLPTISVPDSGSIPVTFEGLCLQTSLGAADEVTVAFK